MGNPPGSDRWNEKLQSEAEKSVDTLTPPDPQERRPFVGDMVLLSLTFHSLIFQ
jgi:hypothetical protein